MRLIFDVLAILLMFVNIIYVVHVFISLKRLQSKNSGMLKKVKLDWAQLYHLATRVLDWIYCNYDYGYERW